MRTCLTRHWHRVQHARFQKHPPQLVERAEARHRRRELTHDGARDGVEDPLRQQYPSSASVIERRAAEQIAIAIWLNLELTPVIRVPGVGHRADILPPRIML